MSENNANYLGTSSTFQLRATVMGLMMKGAGYAALLCVAVGVFIWAFYLIGLALPDASKEAEDPTPLSFELIQPVDQGTYKV